MKKAPMIILLLAPYIFLLIDIGICVGENGFTADAIEMIGWTFMGMFLLIPFLVIFDYFLLLPSTMYGISGLRSLSKMGKSSKAEIVINGICQFLFVFDVISAVYLYIRFRKT